MKNIILALGLFASIGSLAQGSLNTRIAADLCLCYENITAPNKIEGINKIFTSCLPVTLEKYKGELMKAYAIEDTSDYSAGSDLGKKLAPEILSEMIFSCNSFYGKIIPFFDSIKYQLTKGDKAKLESELLKLNDLIEAGTGNEKEYSQRAFVYIRIGVFDKALDDVSKALSMNSKYGLAYFFRAWVYEFTSHNQLARDDFAQAAVLMNKPEISLFSAVEARKSIDKKK